MHREVRIRGLSYFAWLELVVLFKVPLDKLRHWPARQIAARFMEQSILRSRDEVEVAEAAHRLAS